MFFVFLLFTVPEQDLTPVLKDLASPSYRTRERANAELLKCRDLDQLRKHLNHPDPEVAMRVERAYVLAVELVAQTFEPVPNIDAYWYDTKAKGYRPDTYWYPRLIPYFDLSRGMPTDALEDRWPYHARATRMYIRDRIKDGVNLQELRCELALAHSRDVVYIRGVADMDCKPVVDPIIYMLGDWPGVNKCLLEFKDERRLPTIIHQSRPAP